MNRESRWVNQKSVAADLRRYTQIGIEKDNDLQLSFTIRKANDFPFGLS